MRMFDYSFPACAFCFVLFCFKVDTNSTLYARIASLWLSALTSYSSYASYTSYTIFFHTDFSFSDYYGDSLLYGEKGQGHSVLQLHVFYLYCPLFTNFQTFFLPSSSTSSHSLQRSTKYVNPTVATLHFNFQRK